MAAVVKDLVQLNADLQEQKERVETVDFKMITFSLAGKAYGVDIMNVKEIAKADKFTFVPNAASFVRGVYNLRGDIIPIIDLRQFFHLPQEKKTDGQENMLILRINEQVYGTIVDKIDKVVGINHENIQPPHPIFGDINIKFISGVVEKEGELYIILDVIRIFSQKEKSDDSERIQVTEGPYFNKQAAAAEQTAEQKTSVTDSAIGFIKEGLMALRQFSATYINEVWLRKRFNEWSIGRDKNDLQLKGASDADEFLSTFASPCTGTFWDSNYAQAVQSMLPKIDASTIQVWNIGCGKGYETYSFACILKAKYPNKQIKIWANDHDVMAISQAPNMTYEMNELPDYCHEFVVKGKSGYSFVPAIKDAVIFEYHDVLNENPLPSLDIILARDVLSYFNEQDQSKVIESFAEKLKDSGLVILGKNEELSGVNWTFMSKEPVSMFMHNA
ncbi:MAG: chemotaxis protein CheW [Treponema sp.]|jgi:purine-binding chemotaxis protein CheW|nr:chemotaxis protein CheW [Treponema sp.]